MNNKHITIAIDGPAGAGKSTIARRLAANLGCIYVDTGALYRTIALSCMTNGVDPKNETEVVKHLDGINVGIEYREGVQCVLLNGNDVSALIRTPEVSENASVVSAYPKVREFLLEQQRRLARENSVVMDGRDIATVVLPDAKVKIFLMASPEERANRRYKELMEKGQMVVYDEVLSDIKSRDYRDSHREVAPLKCADDAVLVDTTDKNIEQAVAALESVVNSKLSEEK